MGKNRSKSKRYESKKIQQKEDLYDTY